MAKNFFLKIRDDVADLIKVKWRERNQNIVKYWWAVENAAQVAVARPGKVFSVGAEKRKVHFKMMGSFLFCKLPSGRKICYPYPKLKMKKTPWGDMKRTLCYKGMIKGKWCEKKAYGGLLTENITQAVSRDLLASAMLRFARHGHKIVMHVHDEIVIEQDIKSNFSVGDAEKLMSELPPWAASLPISAEGWRGAHYRK